MPGRWVGANSANFKVGRAGYQPQAIVIHIMDGTLAGTDAWFNDPRAKVSAHYGVGKNGDLHQYVKETDTAFHAGIVEPAAPQWPLLKADVNPNFYTVGIEHEGLSDAPFPWSDPQMSASTELVRELAARWAIPVDQDHIVPHHVIRKSKTCPGTHFNWAAYVALVSQGASAPAAPKTQGTVRTLSVVRLRKSPTTASATLRLIAAATDFTVTDVSKGEDVQGVCLWYQGDDGFIWAGATDRPQGLV